MYILGIIVGVILLFGIWFVVTSNNLIAKKNRVKQCQSGICVVLKQRNDMIPNLVASVKTYMGHENQTLTRIAELRSQASNIKNEQDLIRNGNELSALMPKLNVALENYPQLKADTQFIRLQNSIEETELQLQAIRRTYNAAVVEYNNYIEMFPSSFVASRKGHQLAELIDIPEAEKQNVNVGELFK